jgi:hypothetical protein
MTLLDAPEFDEVHERRRLAVFYTTAGLLFVLFIGFWPAALWTIPGTGTATCGAEWR